MHAGGEPTVSCKTYLATLLALDWLGDLLCGAIGNAARPGATTPWSRCGTIWPWPVHVGQLGRWLEGVRGVFVVGRGTSVAAAGTGGLIMKESTHYPAEGLSAASFRHGPFELLTDRYSSSFGGRERSAPLSRKLVADVREAGGRSALVSPRARAYSAFRSAPNGSGR